MLSIARVHAFADNFIWMIHNGREAVCVDPGDAQPVLSYLGETEQRLIGIVLTHWHGDHQGGVEDLKTAYPDAWVRGSKKQLKGPSEPLREGDVIDVLGASFQVLEVPGHTLDHIALVSESTLFPTPVAFTGDTLFAGGCGRLFEGTPEHMFESLSKLNQWPETTQIYCAHEYTEANLRFAVVCEPNNAAAQERLKSVSMMRSRGEATVPSTLSLERQTNPFLRSESSQVLADRRLQKDHF